MYVGERVWAPSLPDHVYCVKDLVASLLMDWIREELKKEKRKTAWEERKKGFSVWKLLQEIQKGNRRRKRQNEGGGGRRGEGYWLGWKRGKERGIEVWRGFLLAVFSLDWCLLFCPLLLFTVLPARLLSGFGSGLQWDWNNTCVTFAFVTPSYMHKHTHKRHTLRRVTDGPFSQSHSSFGSVRPSVRFGQTIKRILPLSPSVCTSVFVRQQCDWGLLTYQQPVTSTAWKKAVSHGVSVCIYVCVCVRLCEIKLPSLDGCATLEIKDQYPFCSEKTSCF